MGRRIQARPAGTGKGVGRAHGAGVIAAAVDAVGIAGDGVNPGFAPKRDGKRQEELGIPPASAPARDRHRGLAAREQDRRSGGGIAVAGDGERGGGDVARDLARFALDGVTLDQRLVSRLFGRDARRLERHFGGRGDDRGGIREARIAGLGRLIGGVLQMRFDRRRCLDAVFPEDRGGVGEGRRIGHRRARCDHRRIVAGNVGDHQRHHPGGRRRRRQPPALDRR